jgi:hypothetical protein
MRIKKTEEEYKYGLTVQDTMVFGEMEWPTVMEDLFMLKVMFTKENGQKIKLMDMVFIHILMEADMKANGTKISSTVLELNNGQMVQNTKANMNKE